MPFGKYKPEGMSPMKRITALFAALVLLISCLPTAALAEAELCQEGCILEAGHEGDCQTEPPATEPSQTPEEVPTEAPAEASTEAPAETTEPSQPAPETTAMDESGEEPYLFARWAPDSEDMLCSFDSLFMYSGTCLFFYFGTEESATVLTCEELTAEGGISIHQAQDNAVEIGTLSIGPAAVCYQADGITYSFPITVTEPDPGEQFAEPTLFATWDHGYGAMSQFNGLWLNTSTSLRFFFGTTGNNIELCMEDLSVEGSLILSTWEGVVFLNHGEDAQPGDIDYICYTTGGTTYKFPVYILGEGSEGGEGPGEDPGITVPSLFATWDDGSGPLTELNGLALNSGSSLLFYFGIPGDAVSLCVDNLSAEGRITLSSQNGMILVSPTAEAQAGDTAYVCYTNGDVTYKFPVILAEASEDGPSQGQVRFYATVPSGTAPITALTDMDPQKNKPLIFWLSTDGIAEAVDPSQLTAEGCVVLEVFNEEVVILSVKADAAPGEIGFVCYGECRFPVQVAGEASEAFDWKATLRYRGEEVTVFVSEIWSEELHDVAGFGDSYGVNYTNPFSRHFVLGALADYEGKSEHLPDKEFYDCITDVSYQLVGSINEDGSREPLNCWLSTRPDGQWEDCLFLAPAKAATELTEVTSWPVYVRANPEMGFKTTLRMTFTYDENPDDNTDPVTYTVDCDGFYQSSGDVILDASTNGSLDTAEKMNEAFSSYENLITWMNENFPDEAHKYQDGSVPGREGGGTITIDLPAVTYDDLIVVQVQSTLFGGLTLRGATDANGNNRTGMPGLLSRGGLFNVRNIDFAASDSVTYPGDKGRSFGIMADYSLLADQGPAGIDWFNDICGVHSCTFTGFYYGLCSTACGYAGFTSECTISGCEYGIYIDCKGTPGGGNDDFQGNAFLGNKTAVCIRNLPNGSSPYSMRFHDNVFLNNHKEFKVTTPGNKHYYYFYRNFYSGKNQDTMLLTATEETPRPAEVEVEGSAIVLTDPCRTSSNLWESSALWVFGDTSILNREADTLLIAEDALAGNQIEVMSDNATQIAVWTFGEIEGGNNQ